MAFTHGTAQDVETLFVIQYRIRLVGGQRDSVTEAATAPNLGSELFTESQNRYSS